MIDDKEIGTRFTLHAGDCLEILKTLVDKSVDALVTDPPAGISFMGKSWDDDKGGRDEWISWLASVMRECMRVMKPGAHGLVWAIPRTSHWTGMALEQAGFEVRDVVTHLFGTGFPKSLDISKAIDKAAGAERTEKVRQKHQGAITNANIDPGWQRPWRNDPDALERSKWDYAPATDAAKQWEGFGTALKPACEFWYLVRKPISEETVAANVLKWGCGGLNIDASRIDGKPRTTHASGNCVTTQAASGHLAGKKPHGPTPAPTGRFPANLVVSHSPSCTDDACASFDANAACDALRAQPMSSILGSLADCQFYHDFYGELFHVVAEGGPKFFASQADVLAFFDLFLISLEHIRLDLFASHRASLGDFLRCAIACCTSGNTSFAALGGDEILLGILHKSYLEACAKTSNNSSGYKNCEIDKHEKSFGIADILDRRPTLDLLNTYLASVLRPLFTTSCAVSMLDEQSGISKSTGGKPKGVNSLFFKNNDISKTANAGGLGDSGGASRFFYCAKASSADKNAGLEGMPKKDSGALTCAIDKSLKTGSGNERDTKNQNFHPTVKSTKLMSYLIRLITPPGGTVLDPFAGSGSTGVAALKEGFRFIGIEREPSYMEISTKRIEQAALTIAKGRQE